jgi:hypothetical protein
MSGIKKLIFAKKNLKASLFHGTKNLAPNRGDTSEPQQLK